MNICLSLCGSKCCNESNEELDLLALKNDIAVIKEEMRNSKTGGLNLPSPEDGEVVIGSYSGKPMYAYTMKIVREDLTLGDFLRIKKLEDFVQGKDIVEVTGNKDMKIEYGNVYISTSFSGYVKEYAYSNDASRSGIFTYTIPSSLTPQNKINQGIPEDWEAFITVTYTKPTDTVSTKPFPTIADIEETQAGLLNSKIEELQREVNTLKEKINNQGHLEPEEDLVIPDDIPIFRKDVPEGVLKYYNKVTYHIPDVLENKSGFSEIYVKKNTKATINEIPNKFIPEIVKNENYQYKDYLGSNSLEGCFDLKELYGNEQILNKNFTLPFIPKFYKNLPHTVYQHQKIDDMVFKEFSKDFYPVIYRDGGQSIWGIAKNKFMIDLDFIPDDFVELKRRLREESMPKYKDLEGLMGFEKYNVVYKGVNREDYIKGSYIYLKARTVENSIENKVLQFPECGVIPVVVGNEEKPEGYFELYFRNELDEFSALGHLTKYYVRQGMSKEQATENGLIDHYTMEYAKPAGFENWNWSSYDGINDCVITSINRQEFDSSKIKWFMPRWDSSIKLNYKVGEPLDLTGLKITLQDDANLEKIITNEQLSEYGITTDPAEGYNLTLEDNGRKVIYTLTNIDGRIVTQESKELTVVE